MRKRGRPSFCWSQQLRDAIIRGELKPNDNCPFPKWLAIMAFGPTAKRAMTTGQAKWLRSKAVPNIRPLPSVLFTYITLTVPRQLCEPFLSAAALEAFHETSQCAHHPHFRPYTVSWSPTPTTLLRIAELNLQC